MRIVRDQVLNPPKVAQSTLSLALLESDIKDYKTGFDG